MNEPKRIPLSDSPRSKEPKKIRLNSYPEPMIDDLWEKIETNHSPPIFAKNNENSCENNSESIQQLESDEIN